LGINPLREEEKQTKQSNQNRLAEPSQTSETHILVRETCPKRTTCLFVTSQRAKETVFQTGLNPKEYKSFLTAVSIIAPF
jgi:hypothetical protein